MTDDTGTSDDQHSKDDRLLADGEGLARHRTTSSKGSPAVRNRIFVGWLADVFDANSYRWVKGSFAFVFLYFGLQKWPVVQGASPVRPPVQAFVEAVGFGGWLPLAATTGLLLIGIYEVTLGMLWLATFFEEMYLGTSRLFLVVAFMTIAHQVVSFLPLVMVPEVAFRQTQFWIPLVGEFAFPVALDWLSAFIFKNLLFIGAFLYCFVEWAERYGPRRGDGIARE